MLGIKTILKISKQNKELKKEFPTSNLKVSNVIDIDKIKIGNYSYGNIKVLGFGKHDSQLKIGNYCSIAQDVTFLLGGEHNYKYISTFPFKKIFNGIDEAESKGDIIVKDDVWIGYGSIILSGVTIGQGAVIGAGSVVCKDIPPYAIYANNRIIKYRFSEDIIQELLKIDYLKLSDDFIKNNMKKLYDNITSDNVKEYVDLINKNEKE